MVGCKSFTILYLIEGKTENVLILENAIRNNTVLRTFEEFS